MSETTPADTDTASLARDSVITYSTDVVGSSVADTQTIETFSTKQKSLATTQGDSSRFYHKKRFWAIFVAVSVVTFIIAIPLVVLVIFPVVAQKTINNSQLNLTSIEITNPTNDSFIMSSAASVSSGGSFKSTINFQSPVIMLWDDTEIGNVEFDPIHIDGGSASTGISNKSFTVTNPKGLSDFSVALLNGDSIKLTFKSTVSVKALGITKGGLTLNKDVTMLGANKLGTPKVVNFTVDQPDESTLLLNVTVSVFNPSVFSMAMGKIGFGVSYNGTFISNMVIDDFNLVPGEMVVSMIGNASIPQSDVDRANFGSIMSAYLTNTPVITNATGQYAYPDHINPVSWLTSSVQSLTLNAAIGDAPSGPPQLITGLNFGSPSFNFTPEAITLSSNNTVADYHLPFHVSTNIQQISQNATLYDVASVLPLATFNTSQFPTKDDQNGKLTMNIPPTPLNVYPGSEIEFGFFVAKMLVSSVVDFNITGSSNVLANTVIGPLPISNLPFTLNVSLPGFSNFSTSPPKVNSVTVTDGTSDALIILIDATLENPSNTSISTGETSFEVVFGDSVIGHASVFLSLAPGLNDLKLNSTMDPANNPAASELLKNFIGGQPSNVTLEGYENSTEVPSLKLALSNLKLEATVPAQLVKMIAGSTLKILGTSDVGVNAAASVTMFNPFVATLNILTIDANITVDGDTLAGIQVDRSKDPIVLPGNKTTEVQDLPINLNLDKVVLFGLLRRQAQSVGLDTSVIDALITIGKIPVPGVPPTTTIDPDKIKNFDIKSYVQTALAKITTNMTLLSTVKIGEYVMPFPYTQLNTVSQTDPSIVQLIPLLSRSIAQTLIDGSTLGFDSLSIQNLAEDSFVTVINGGVKNAGPLPAVITFPSGADLVFNNEVLGTVSLPPITVDGGQASLKDVKSSFQVKNKAALAAFAGQLLSSDSVTWTVKAENITVNALKIPIDGVSMIKDVSLKGSNGFKDAVTINSYDLPGDAPNGGISTTINATLENSGSVGITLGVVQFDVLSGSTKIGEVSTSGLSIAPSTSSDMKLSGRLIPQSGDGLNVIAKIFSDVLAGKEIPLLTKGSGLQPPISWLIPAITKLAIDTTLPSIKIPQIVRAVTINEMSLKFTQDTAYDPITSSNITAQISIPFGFTLNIQEMSEDVVLINDNKNMARLVVPKNKAHTTGRNVSTSYSDIDLKVFDDAHDSFDSFVKDLTIGNFKTFGFNGSSDTQAQTPVGTIPLSGIPINVSSGLPGFQGFNAKPVTIGSLDVKSGTPKVLTIPITTSLFNPTSVTISVGDVSFSIITASNIPMGQVVFNNLVLAPNNNNLTATTLLSPPSQEIAGIFLSQFISNISQPLIIVGTEDSTNIDSLKLAFSQIKLNTTVPPFGKRLLLSTFVNFQNDTLITGKALGGFTITNPFASDITISEMKQVNITFHDIPMAFISNFSFPLTVKGRKTTTSPPLPINVILTPPNLVAIVKAAAADKDIDITPLLPLLELIGGGNKSHSESQLSKSGSDDQNALKLLEKILGTLNVNVSMSSNVLIDQFPAPLSFAEEDVPCTVNGVDIIIIQTAIPIAQNLVDNSTITVDTAIMSDEQPATFNLHINGVIGNVGKVKAKITFPTGVNVSTEGKELGIAKLPPVTSNGTGEASINSDSVFQITNVPNFSEFVLVLLGGPSANWTLSADDVQVDASGIPVSGIKFSKVVPLLGFDGLKQVKVLGFNLPGIAPDGNVILDIDISLENPSNVGISLGTITFNVFSDQLLVGPITATGVTLAPKSAANISFTGEIVIKDPKILSQLIAVLFSGKGNLTAKGDTIKPPGAKGDVPWLSGPFKQLALVVPIPSLPTTSPVKSVSIKSLDLAFTVDTAFNPDSSSSGMVAEIQLPIRLPSPIISVSQNITIIDEDGGKVASLVIASAPATQVGENVTSTYKNVPLTAIDKAAFAKFIGELTIGTEKNFVIAGIVSSTLKEFSLPPIPFSVKTSMKGLQALRSSPTTISNVSITSSDAKGIKLSMSVSLTNPSDAQVSAGDISLDVLFEKEIVGTTEIQNITLARGKNTYQATFIFSPQGDGPIKAGADLLGNFLTNKSSALIIKGNGQTTNIPSLAPTFSSLVLTPTLDGLPVQTVKNITVTVGPDVLKTKQGLASFVIVNPLNKPYSITGMVAKALLKGQEIGLVNVPKVPPILIAAQSEKTITGIPFEFTINVALLPGLLGKTIYIDLDATAFANLGDYQSQIHLTESNVPTTIQGTVGTTTTITTTATKSSSPSSPASKGSPAALKKPSTN